MKQTKKSGKGFIPLRAYQLNLRHPSHSTVIDGEVLMPKKALKPPGYGIHSYSSEFASLQIGVDAMINKCVVFIKTSILTHEKIIIGLL